ncbi:MAG: hypothetical protein A3F09_05720 [Chlamydiae bacterium RIFCSPHIGHO2_12_FULL_49_11]|nr:MAG: hypothetical protein A3F09_05720 [Chlamydiae bacterium RIFCSPHIGHO2_12_FULL_49_11]
MTKKRSVLLTYAQSIMTLDLARALHREGATVYVVDTHLWHICKNSNAVKRSFVAPPPRFKPLEFMRALIAIINEVKIDLVIPMWEDSFIVAKFRAMLPESVEVFCDTFEKLDSLHHKGKFIQLMNQFDIPAAKTAHIQTPADLSRCTDYPFALKACYSRASQAVYKIASSDQIPSHIKIDAAHTWIAQEWIEGINYCTYSIAREGKLLAHSTYPVEYSIGKFINPKDASVPPGSACTNFRHIVHPAIEAWVKNIVEKLNYTGQIAFDLVVKADGVVYAVECNPRMTSGIVLVSEKKGILNAFTEKEAPLITPDLATRKKFAPAMLLFGWRAALEMGKFFSFLGIWFSYRDIVFHWKDLGPFFTQPLIWAHYIFTSRRRKITLVTFALEDQSWNGEEISLS